jgi:hypothetical protein
VDWRQAVLCDGDIELRPWRDGDSEAVGTSQRDPVTGRYFGRGLHGPKTSAPDPDAPSYLIAQDGEPVGRVWCVPGVRPFEIGYFVRTDLWGRGIATRALKLVTNWMLEQSDIDQIVLFIHPENIASQRVAEHAGYARDGVMQDYAEFKDGSTAAIRFVRIAATLNAG